ncbi:MAG: hypothetical protein A2157_04940 [Deltaproteobacteria bacterium RBG_16_47_11]|nr:MAG: hypothetical protein A2157_04940 [Deltaproteobacteria bacterium RBG_16_47_11]
MKVLLLQLPIQTHDFFFSHENIPLASAYLQVIASEQGIDAELLPAHLMRYGSDQAILKYIRDEKPDIVGMSCYLWNLERSLYLGRTIKNDLPECTVVLGGPEIASDNDFLLEHGDFDIGVVGEGEEVWRHLLQSFPDVSHTPCLLLREKGRRYHFTGNGKDRTPLRPWASPFLRGVLDSQPGGVLWLETVRGCVYRCAYCYYHKQSPRLRTFPVERILNEVRRAWEQGLEQIVFLDPCFIRRPHLEPLLDGMAAINHDRRLRLHAESTAEGIHSKLAKKMGKAGFVEIEVGLQSVNQKALRRIHRTFRPQKFLEGARCLQSYDIEVMVDIIAGLPGDTLPDICKSIDWVMEQEVYDTLMLYPLGLMPSTELTQRRIELGLAGMPYPPYLLTKGPGLTAPEMCQAFRYYEESMEEDISLLEMPPTLNPRSEVSSSLKGLCNLVNWYRTEQVMHLGQIGDRTTYALTIRVAREVLKKAELWLHFLKDYLEQNPFTLLSVEVPFDVFPEEIDPLWHLTREHHHPADRDYTVTHTPYRSFFLFSRNRGLFWKWPDPRESSPLELHDGQKVDCRPVCLVISQGKTIPPWFLEHIRKRYPSPPEIRLWEPPED